ncbi:MAG: hypothetical protein WD534_15135 [Phycisphaeraceae bacterium]
MPHEQRTALREQFASIKGGFETVRRAAWLFDERLDIIQRAVSQLRWDAPTAQTSEARVAVDACVEKAQQQQRDVQKQLREHHERAEAFERKLQSLHAQARAAATREAEVGTGLPEGADHDYLVTAEDDHRMLQSMQADITAAQWGTSSRETRTSASDKENDND